MEYAPMQNEYVKSGRRCYPFVQISILTISICLFTYLLTDISVDQFQGVIYNIYGRAIPKLPQTTPTPKYQPMPAHYRRDDWNADCGRISGGDTNYTKFLAIKRKTVRSRNITDGYMTCEAIKSRVLPARNADTGFPMLHARNVFQDYDFLEEQLAVGYAAENVYCYTIDSKASQQLKDRFKTMGRCLPNVFVNGETPNIDSSGHNQNKAHFSCMRSMMNETWKYAMLMQNHDVLIKTHKELSDILTIFGGVNDVEITPCNSGRCPSSLETNLGKLGLCAKSLNATQAAHCQSSNITWSKGSNQAILSFEAVKFMFEEIDINPVMNELNDMPFGVDEVMVESLQVTDEIGLPGGFTSRCPMAARQIFRHSIWDGNCKAGWVRHAICVYGMEDIPMLASQRRVMANKFIPDFDYTAVSCMAEVLWNRTRGIVDHPIDVKFYENINFVRYHRERKQVNFTKENFKCEL